MFERTTTALPAARPIVTGVSVTQPTGSKKKSPIVPNVSRTEDGKLDLFVPTEKRGWRRQLRHILPLAEEKNIELDYLGAEFFSLCDGKCTVEEIVDDYMKRWNLSFFEARGLVLQFLRGLMRSGLVALATPALGEDEGEQGDED